MMQSMYNKKRGIFFIVAAAFNFSTMNMFARLAGDIPAMQKTFFRNLVAILVISTILLLRRQRITVKKAHLPALLARSRLSVLFVLMRKTMVHIGFFFDCAELRHDLVCPLVLADNILQ